MPTAAFFAIRQFEIDLGAWDRGGGGGVQGVSTSPASYSIISSATTTSHLKTMNHSGPGLHVELVIVAFVRKDRV